MKDLSKLLEEALREYSRIKGSFLLMEREIRAVSLMVVETVRQEGKVILFGNGGSLSDAQHIAAEMVNRLKFTRPAIPAIALGMNPSFLTSISNDSSFLEVFERELTAMGSVRDMVIAISTSGRSENVLRGLRAAGKMGLKRAGLSGEEGFPPDLVDLSIRVPSRSVQRVQEAHIFLGHIICEMVEYELFGGDTDHG